MTPQYRKEYQTTGSRVRALVLRELAARPRTGAELGDDLAARAGDKRAVLNAVQWAKNHGLVALGADKRWSLTQAGVARAKGEPC